MRSRRNRHPHRRLPSDEERKANPDLPPSPEEAVRRYHAIRSRSHSRALPPMVTVSDVPPRKPPQSVHVPDPPEMPDLQHVLQRIWMSMTPEERYAAARRAIGKDFRADIVHVSDFRQGDLKDIGRDERDRERLADIVGSYGLDRLGQDGRERVNVINHIAATQSPRYGYHREQAEVPSTVIDWSNGAAAWYPTREVQKGEEVGIDANEILVPYTRSEVLPAVPFLANHWAYALSFEGKPRDAKGNVITSQEWARRWKAWFDAKEMT